MSSLIINRLKRQKIALQAEISTLEEEHETLARSLESLSSGLTDALNALKGVAPELAKPIGARFNVDIRTPEEEAAAAAAAAQFTPTPPSSAEIPQDQIIRPAETPPDP